MKKIIVTCILLWITVSVSAKSTDGIKITRLYSDQNGVSHFATITLPTDQKIIPIPDISTTAIIPGDGFIVSHFNQNFFWDWHTPPQGDRYLDIILSGEERLDASDGTSRTFKAGDLLLLEDNTGKGHRAQGLTDGTELTIKLSSTKKSIN